MFNHKKFERKLVEQRESKCKNCLGKCLKEDVVDALGMLVDSAMRSELCGGRGEAYQFANYLGHLDSFFRRRDPAVIHEVPDTIVTTVIIVLIRTRRWDSRLYIMNDG